MFSGHGAGGLRLGVCPGQEIVDLAHGPAVDETAQDVGEIGLGIDGVDFASLDQRSNDAPMNAAAVMAGEECIFSFMPSFA